MTIGIVLALLSAAAYGTADFAGGLLSRNTHFARVGLASQCASATAVVAAAIVTRAALPSATQTAWGIAAGFGAGLGSLTLYRGLARGHMAVAGPLSALGAAGLPVVVDIARGGDLAFIAWLGVAVAVPGIGLVAAGTDRGRGGLVEGLVAGGGFGTLFIGLDQAGGGSGIWPVVASQLTGLVLLTLVVAATRSTGGARLGSSAFVPGLIGVSGTALYFQATQRSALAVAAVVTSLYPAVTVALATTILGEQLRPRRAAGLVMCGAAVVALSLA